MEIEDKIEDAQRSESSAHSSIAEEENRKTTTNVGAGAGGSQII